MQTIEVSMLTLKDQYGKKQGIHVQVDYRGIAKHDIMLIADKFSSLGPPKSVPFLDALVI